MPTKQEYWKMYRDQQQKELDESIAANSKEAKAARAAAEAQEAERVNAQLRELYPTVFDTPKQSAASSPATVAPSSYSLNVNPSDRARSRGWTNMSHNVPAATNTANPAPTVETEYQKQQDLMAMEQQAANRNAVTAYQRAMKYLPQMQKEQGLYGLGVSESGQIAAQNDLMSRLAQTDLYYDQLREQQNAEKSSQYLQMAASQMENATSLDEIRDIADRYKPYLSDGDKNTLDLYLSQVESPAYQERVQQSKVDALWESARSGGYTFKHNWAGGADKWAKGGQFVIEEANGKNRNVEIAEVNPSGDDVLIGLANKAHDQDLFFYNGDLYMVYDHDTDSGEKKRELYRLAFKSGTGKTNMLKAYQAQA